MNITRQIGILIMALALPTFHAAAQPNIDDCEKLVKKKKIEKAINCFESKLPADTNNIQILCRLCELHYEQKNLPLSKSYAKRAIIANANAAFHPIYYIAQKMSFRRNNETAVYLLDLLGNNISDPAKKQRLGSLKASYLLQKYELNEPRYNVILDNLGDSINSAESEYMPSLSLDGNTLVFTRRVGGANEDFFIAEKDTNGIWGAAKNIGYPPNTSFPDGAAKISADGNYLFFTRCDMRSPNGIERGGCDLVFCYRNGMQDGQIIWSAPQYFAFTINTTAYEGQPCLSSDNRDLYFVSDREGGFGGKDIYVSHFRDNLWSIPENLGPMINTEKDETTPFIHTDNETLYFASNGHPSLGDADLFVSRKEDGNSWKKAINLGSPINTVNTDGGVIVNARGTMGYVGTERPGSRGQLDIYSFELYEGIKPIPTLCVKGKLMDKKTRQLVKNEKITFYTKNIATTLNTFRSNKGDASYTQALHIGKEYLMEVMVDGYRPFYKHWDLRQDTFPDNIIKDIRLKKPGIVDTIGTFCLDLDTNNVLTDESIQLLENLKKDCKDWYDDSAYVKIYININYYYGDSDSDATAHQGFRERLIVANNIRQLFAAQQVPKANLIVQTKPYLWRDESISKDFIELFVVEFY